MGFYLLFSSHDRPLLLVHCVSALDILFELWNQWYLYPNIGLVLIKLYNIRVDLIEGHTFGNCF